MAISIVLPAVAAARGSRWGRPPLILLLSPRVV
jgi:hypothetical protein